MKALPSPVGVIYLWSLLWLIRRSKSILDIGCGRTSPVRYSHAPRKRGIDGFAPALESARTLGTHTEYVQADIHEALQQCQANEFETVVALDLIEHLPQEKGEALLKDMERVASRRIVIFTPNGFMQQDTYDNNILQEHLSGWTAEDFHSRGYTVIGMHGLKQLRTGLQLKYHPHALWAIVSALSQIYCFWRPSSACHLLAWKDV